MKAKRFLGFTLIELIATIAVILVLTGIVLAVTTSGKDAAKQVRCRDVAATLNEAERSYVCYASHVCPGLGRSVAPYQGSDAQSRISYLQTNGFLGHGVDATNVYLSTDAAGCVRWEPAVR